MDRDSTPSYTFSDCIQQHLLSRSGADKTDGPVDSYIPPKTLLAGGGGGGGGVNLSKQSVKILVFQYTKAANFDYSVLYLVLISYLCCIVVHRMLGEDRTQIYKSSIVTTLVRTWLYNTRQRVVNLLYLKP